MGFSREKGGILRKEVEASGISGIFGGKKWNFEEKWGF